MSDIDIKALRALHEAATPGPWTSTERNYGHAVAVVGSGWRVALCDTQRPDRNAADAALIVAAVNALPALLDRLERAERAGDLAADVERLKARVREMETECGRLDASAMAARVAKRVREEERDEARADLESVWHVAGEKLGDDRGMDAYTPGDAMANILDSLIAERDAARDAHCALLDAIMSSSDEERRVGVAKAMREREGWGR